MSTDARLRDAASQGPKEYYEAVLAETRQIHDRLNAADKLTAIVFGEDPDRIKDLLSASLILNDCTSVVFNAGGNLKVNVPMPSQYKSMFGTDVVRFNVSKEQIVEHGIDPINPSIQPCFFYTDTEAQRPLLNALLPFIEGGNVVFQPTRGVLTKSLQPKSWHIIGVDHKQPLDLWEPEPRTNQVRPKPLEVQSPNTSTEALFEITVPYLKGVPLRELHAMLRDEHDLVLAFRASIRTTVKESTKSGAAPADIINDVVRPKVIALDRKLRSLQRIHRLKVGGAAMSSVALAFTAASAGSLGGSLLAIASAGGFGFVANQYSDYLARLDELKQDPYYFLWKIRRSSGPKA
jgi:hypothetical protein